jgi:hypothetical protein
VEARRAHSSRVKSVPRVAAATRPAVVLAGRPAAERASDAGAGRIEAFLLIRLAVQDHRSVIRKDAHATVLWRSLP